jgi:hypothetical protein
MTYLKITKLLLQRHIGLIKPYIDNQSHFNKKIA